jgi:hypothetical protein
MKLFHGTREELIAAAIISFCFGSALGLFAAIQLEDQVNVIAALLAAGVGAYIAFWLNGIRAKEETNKRNVQAANYAIFNLHTIRNSFITFRNQFIDPERNSPIRYVSIEASLGFDNWCKEFDFESLSFLLNSNDPSVLYNLYQLQTEVSSTIDQIKERNRIHYEKVQPIMSDAGLHQGSTATKEEIAEVIGSYYVPVLENMTEDMISNVDLIISLSFSRANHIYTLSKATYPKYSHLLIKIPNKPLNSDAKSGAR